MSNLGGPSIRNLPPYKSSVLKRWIYPPSQNSQKDVLYWAERSMLATKKMLHPIGISFQGVTQEQSHKLNTVPFHHHVVPLARISLILSRHFSLSFIASGRSSGLHPVSSHSCWMYVHAGRPAFVPFTWPKKSKTTSIRGTNDCFIF